jgi:NAD(P)-dependent dehydrogenase (short-subunit alcohol dehydrogenase family)
MKNPPFSSIFCIISFYFRPSPEEARDFGIIQARKEHTMNRSVLITGGTSGIGLAAARILAQEGWAPVLMGRDSEKGKSAALAVKGSRFVQADVTKTEDCERAVKEASQWGTFSGVVTAAGIYEEKLLTNLTDEEIEHFFAVNVFGTMKIIRAAVPLLKRGSSIVTVSSDAALQGNVQCSLYGATKGAVTAFTKSAALELAVDGIRANVVCPGDIKTPLLEEQIKTYGGSEKEMGEGYPLMRIGKPEEVGEVIAFLLSEKSSFMTGAVVPVDGGLTDW